MTENSGPAQDYRQLRVYELAFASAMSIFDLSKTWPGEEKYSLTDQIRRSSRSVCANNKMAFAGPSLGSLKHRIDRSRVAPPVCGFLAQPRAAGRRQRVEPGAAIVL